MSNLQDTGVLPWDVRPFRKTQQERIVPAADDVFVAPSQVPSSTLPSAVVSGYLTSARKRLLDVVVASALVIVLSPLLALVALMIATTSRGPVIFRQVRNGINGEPFTIYKFRSMTAAACSASDVQQAARGDSRITPIGRFIRRTSIDELPQLLNVIEGSMSLVGPRPHAISHDAHFGSLVSLYSWRFAARPGITGLAQTRGARGGTPRLEDMERRVTLDIHYIRDASLVGDFGILLRTVKETIASSSAY